MSFAANGATLTIRVHASGYLSNCTLYTPKTQVTESLGLTAQSNNRLFMQDVYTGPNNKHLYSESDNNANISDFYHKAARQLSQATQYVLYTEMRLEPVTNTITQSQAKFVLAALALKDGMDVSKLQGLEAIGQKLHNPLFKAALTTAFLDDFISTQEAIYLDKGMQGTLNQNDIEQINRLAREQKTSRRARNFFGTF